MNRKALLLSFVAFYTFLFLPFLPLWAEEIQLPSNADRTAPVVQHEPPGQSAPSAKDLVIQATITDNVAVKEAFLFYRPLGNTEYFSINMNPVGNNLYAATIPKEDVQEPGIEYYIQAADPSGNTVLRGFSFSPLMITVAPVLPAPKGGNEPAAVAPAPSSQEPLALKTEAPATSPWYKKWWVWAIAAGVVVIAAAAGGGGGGGGGGGSPGPSTGSATVSGPIP
ncbi:MAG: hypothetical protein HY204_05645 [Nitrospirae bacterium]|nr:hypothetical protein [Nitrospirota bacterium]